MLCTLCGSGAWHTTSVITVSISIDALLFYNSIALRSVWMRRFVVGLWSKLARPMRMVRWWWAITCTTASKLPTRRRRLNGWRGYRHLFPGIPSLRSFKRDGREYQPRELLVSSQNPTTKPDGLNSDVYVIFFVFVSFLFPFQCDVSYNIIHHTHNHHTCMWHDHDNVFG